VKMVEAEEGLAEVGPGEAGGMLLEVRVTGDEETDGAGVGVEEDAGVNPENSKPPNPGAPWKHCKVGRELKRREVKKTGVMTLILSELVTRSESNYRE